MDTLTRWQTMARMQNAIEGLKNASIAYGKSGDDFWHARMNEWEIIIAQCLDLLDK